MAGSIDSVDVQLFWGRVAGLKSRLDIWEVAGQDGCGVEVLGLGDSDFDVKFASYFHGSGYLDDAETFIAACEALQGTIVTIVDAFGTSFDGCLIEHVETADCEKPCILYGDNAVRVGIQIKCKRMPT